MPSRPRSDEWFRSDAWGEDERAEFETKLARAKPQYRVQYLRIKAVALLGSGERQKELAGTSLLHQILEDADAPAFERTGALSLLGSHEQHMGRLDAAEKYTRAALDEISHHRNGSDDLEETRLAEILLARGQTQQLEEARRLLNGRTQRPPRMLKSRFRWATAGVKVSLALNDRPAAARWAAMALAIAAAEHSGLANHPTLGLVSTDEETRAWLIAVAAEGGSTSNAT